MNIFDELKGKNDTETIENNRAHEAHEAHEKKSKEFDLNIGKILEN